MKTSNKIIIVVLFSTLTLLIFFFAKTKYDKRNMPKDYNSTKFDFGNITTIVFDNLKSCYIQSGDSNEVDFRYWGKNENLPTNLCVKNDTLFLNHQFKNSSSSIHLRCKNLKVMVVQNKSYLSMTNFGSKHLRVEALGQSHIMLNHIGDTTYCAKELNIEFNINERSTLSIQNSKLNYVSISATKSFIDVTDSEIKDFSLHLKSGSELFYQYKRFAESFNIKSDNKSKYHIQYNEKK